MQSKRALSITLIAGISLWALTCILPDQSASAASRVRAERVSEQSSGGSPVASSDGARLNTGVHLSGDPDQTTQSGDPELRPVNPQPQPPTGSDSGGRTFLSIVLDTLLQGFGMVRSTLRF
jgi:hypothetical protein